MNNTARLHELADRLNINKVCQEANFGWSIFAEALCITGNVHVVPTEDGNNAYDLNLEIFVNDKGNLDASIHLAYLVSEVGVEDCGLVYSHSHPWGDHHNTLSREADRLQLPTEALETAANMLNRLLAIARGVPY